MRPRRRGVGGDDGAGRDRRLCQILSQTDMIKCEANFADLSITGSKVFLQQFLSIRMHSAQLFGDGCVWAVFLAPPAP